MQGMKNTFLKVGGEIKVNINNFGHKTTQKLKMTCARKYVEINDLFLDMHCEKNAGGTRNLVLRGKEMFDKIGRRINDTDLVRIIIYLRKNQDVVALEFPYNEITNCGMSQLANYFEERPVVRYLNVVGNNIGARGVKYLADLEERLSLFSLRLTGNKLGDEGGKVIAHLLRHGKTSLRYLDLSDTNQSLTGLAHVMTALMPSRGGTRNLQYIDIGRPLPTEYHQINDGHAAEFVSQILQDNKSLQEIHLQQYQFDFRDMEILLEGLLANNTLVCLDLNNNNIADDGVDYLCKYLKTSPPLECLMISANNIGELGGLALSFNLPFSNIRLLDISHNRITDEGMINIFYTIEKTEKMRALFMWGNKFTHRSLVVLHRLYKTKLLDPEHCDVELYCADKELHASWNYLANRYAQRFYCVTRYDHLAQTTITYNPGPPLEKPPIYYKYHVDNKDVGFPLCEWTMDLRSLKYVYVL